MNKWSAGLIILLILGLAGSIFFLRSASSQLVEERLRVDSLAGEVAEESLRADGWETRWADETADLSGQLSVQDEVLASAMRDLVSARGEVQVLTRTLAEGSGVVVDTVEVMANCPNAFYQGSFDDGLLRGNWELAPPIFRMPYTVSIEQELIHTLMGDGRMLVTARALDSKVNLQVEDLLFQPPLPVTIRKSSWRSLFTSLSIGTILGLLIK